MQTKELSDGVGTMISMPVPAPSYAAAMVQRLESLRATYLEMVRRSDVLNIDPNRGRSDVVFIGFPKWGWAPSDPAHQSMRMGILRDLAELRPLVELLFPHPTPELKKRNSDAFRTLETWAERSGRNDRSVPSTIDKAVGVADKAFDALLESLSLSGSDEFGTRLVVDTNILIDNPDLAAFVPTLGPCYRVHLLPVVLSELNEHKANGRNPEIREAAKRADRRLKGLRNQGVVTQGVTVSGQVSVVFEHKEPRSDLLPTWLDLTIGDDRLVASALLLQSEHPGSAIYVGTSDINLQTKLAAVGLPYVELPSRTD